MVVSSTRYDYYAILQLHPDADREVIDAAYRQLMKKYHPDKAGGDPARIAIHHQRAKAINEAYRTLRDPVQRLAYDRAHDFVASPRADPRPPQGPVPGQPPAATSPYTASSATATRPTDDVDWAELHESEPLLSAALHRPLAALAAAYYLLPGPYEWEKGRTRDLLTTCLVPLLSVAAFCLATGRLAPWIGHSLSATLLAWAILFLLSCPAWSSLLRVLVAALPSVVLLVGILDPLLRQASVPVWLAWVMLSMFSLLLSARLYVFGVLPALGVCWLLTRLS